MGNLLKRKGKRKMFTRFRKMTKAAIVESEMG